MIVPRIIPAAGMEVGMVRTVIVIPAGAAAIVPSKIHVTKIAGMGIGVNRIITVPADVPVIPAGAAAIVRKRPDQPVRITVIGLLRVMGPTADSALVIPAGAAAIVRKRIIPVAGMEHGNHG